MPSPSSSLATQRPDLADSLREFDLEMDTAGFIGHRVMPVSPVANQSGTFGKIPIEELLQARDTKRAPGSGYNRGEFKFETATYATEEHGVEEPVDDREAAMYANYFDAEVVSTQRAQRAIVEAQEKRIASLIFNTTTFSPTTVTTEWSTAASAVPLTDVESKVQAIYGASGLWPNTMIVRQKGIPKSSQRRPDCGPREVSGVHGRTCWQYLSSSDGGGLCVGQYPCCWRHKEHCQ